jgi:hypothetical protein
MEEKEVTVTVSKGKAAEIKLAHQVRQEAVRRSSGRQS